MEVIGSENKIVEQEIVMQIVRDRPATPTAADLFEPTTTAAMPITDWPSNERPRERLAHHGPKALSDAELLAILLRTGMRGKSAVDLAREILAQTGGPAGLFGYGSRQPSHQVREPTVSKTPPRGLGPAKLAQLHAAFELARRALHADLVSGPCLASPALVREFLALELRGRPYEVFLVLFLDTQHRVIAVEELFRGTLAQTSVYPREVVRAGLAHNAAAVILAHNHPSGIPDPSQEDRALTRALVESLRLVDIKVLDHIVIAGAIAFSFAERGLI
jgi:DNA repair protein RadC